MFTCRKQALSRTRPAGISKGKHDSIPGLNPRTKSVRTPVYLPASLHCACGYRHVEGGLQYASGGLQLPEGGIRVILTASATAGLGMGPSTGDCDYQVRASKTALGATRDKQDRPNYPPHATSQSS